jgi:rhodanese-related sulfurtransferase
MTASWLMRMGFPRVRVFRGGLDAWKATGGEIQAGHHAMVPFGLDAARAHADTVAPAALERELSGSSAPIVIDVDESDPYIAGHVSGAVWLCRSRLELTAPKLLGQRAVVVTCADGVASTLSVAALKAAGVGQVRVLAGGKKAWTAAGLTLEKGATALGDEVDDIVLKPYQRGRDAMEAYLRWETDLDEHGGSPHALLPGIPKP